MTNLAQQRERADRLAMPMFALSLLFLVLLAGLIVVWVDIPRVAELADLQVQEVGDEGDAEQQAEQLRLAALSAEQNQLMHRADRVGWFLNTALLLLWPLFWLEYFITLRDGNAGARFYPNGLVRLVVCFLPPLRLGTPSAAWDGRIWLPILHWQVPGKALSRSLEQRFSKPMLLIALLILPVLLIEFGLSRLVEDHFWLRMMLHISTGLIWCAFTVEFIILVSATDRKLAYVKKHWIDLAIIILPLISFLRTVRLLRLGRLARVQRLAKMGRIYRMRGLMMKALRALMLMEVVSRLLRITPEKKLKKLYALKQERLEELDDIQEDIDALEADLNLTTASGHSDQSTAKA